MPNSKKRTNLFYKYLVSYFSIFLLPIIIVGVFIYSYFFGVFKDEIINNNMHNLEKTKNTVDTQLLQLKNISELIHYNSALNPFHFESEPLQALAVIRELNKFKLTNSFFIEIILYYRGDNFLYTSTSSSNIDKLVSNIYKFENWTLEDFKKDINTVSLPTIRPTENMSYLLDYGKYDTRVATFIFPLSYDGYHAKKTALFFVPETSFKKLINNSVENYHGNTIIFDNKNNIIASLEKYDYMNSDTFNHLLNSFDTTGSQTAVLNNEEYHISFISSSETGWKYLTLIPSSSVFSKVTSVQLILLFIILIILFVGVIIIAIFMNVNYKPIKSLGQLSEKLLANENASMNELDTVRNAIEYLNSRNTKLQDELQSNEYAIKEYLLFRLLNGHILNIADINGPGEAIGLKFSKSNYRVICFYMKNFKKTFKVDSSEITNLIESNLPVEIEGFVRDNSDNEQFALIISYDKIDDTVFENVLIKIHSILKGRLNMSVTVGIGNPYESISDVPKSFMESITAVDYRLIKGRDRLIHINEIAVSSSKFDVAITHAPERLKMYIKQGNIEQIENLLTNILSYLKQSTIPIFSARLICYDIINTVSKTVNEFCKDHLIPVIEYPDVFLLSEFETVDELVNTVRNLSDDISKHLKNSTVGTSSTTIDQMIAYIKANYTDCDFSVQHMADHFNMALPNLSSYFKQNTGHNILDYVTNLRIEKAKHLLITTNIPLKDVGMEVGYYNATSFIRRFKQVVGETPGEYRKRPLIPS